MKILFLSFYFEPDLCAGSFRNTALLEELIKQLPEDSVIDVITTLPSRYLSFSADARDYEKLECANIHRVKLPIHKSGMLDQSKAFITYAKAVISISKTNKYDLIYSSSSRLMTACLGSYLSYRFHVPLYLDIRDIFVDTIKDVLPAKFSWLLKPLFSIIEKWTFSRATKINLVSEGFKDYFDTRYSHVPLSYFTNGIDDEFLMPVNQNDNQSVRNVPEVLYAGNIGEGQGLHNIIPELAKKFEGKLLFKIIGDGGRRRHLEDSIKASNVKNVIILNPVGRADLINAYLQADVLFMHLNDYDAFLKVLPSKVFEYAALGKPIWAGVSGYAAKFVNENVSNAAVFSPCDVADAVRSFDLLDLASKPRTEFVSNYSRKNIMVDMATDIISTIGSVK